MTGKFDIAIFGDDTQFDTTILSSVRELEFTTRIRDVEDTSI